MKMCGRSRRPPATASSVSLPLLLAACSLLPCAADVMCVWCVGYIHIMSVVSIHEVTEALTHGTLPWTIEGKTRTTLFYK
jgi:hypothetical protein